MMKKLKMFMIMIIIINISCTPRIVTRLDTSMPRINNDQEIRILWLNASIPADAEVLGTIKIGDTGFSTDCGFETVLKKAREEARNAGGDAIKVTEHLLPGKSTCHILTAKILRLNTIPETTLTSRESGTIGTDYAVLNIYSDPAIDVPFNYDLLQGDSVLCRLNNNFKKTIQIKKEGIVSFRLNFLPESEINTKIRFGEIYYLRCGLSQANPVECPVIETVDPATGNLQFDIFLTK